MTGGHGICALRGLHARHHQCCTACSCGWRCPTTPATPPRDFAAPRARSRPPRRRHGAGLPRHAAGQHLPGAPPPLPCSAPSWCSTRGAALTLDVDPDFEHGVLVDTGGLSSGGHRAGRADLGYLPPGPADPDARQPQPTCRPGPPARRHSVRGGAPDVVELRRPHPRGDRRVPRGLAGRVRALRPGRGLPGSRYHGCRPPRCRTRGSAPGRTPRPRPPRPREASTPVSPAPAAPGLRLARPHRLRRRGPGAGCPGGRAPRPRGIRRGRAAAGGCGRAGPPPPRPSVDSGRGCGACCRRGRRRAGPHPPGERGRER